MFINAWVLNEIILEIGKPIRYYMCEPLSDIGVSNVILSLNVVVATFVNGQCVYIEIF